MYVYHIEMCVCAHYVRYTYTLQVHMFASDNSHTLYWMRLVISKPQEIHF